jgi:hypothetical protein
MDPVIFIIIFILIIGGAVGIIILNKNIMKQIEKL